MRRQTCTFPVGLVLETTTRCNAQCITCPHGTKADLSGLVMDIPSFERLIDECVEKQMDRVELSFYGEPLLDPHIVARVAKVRDVLGPETPVGFFSNGSLMTPAMAVDLLHAGLSYASFSIDGATAESFEYVRRGLRYNEVVANIKDFVELNNSLGRPCRVRTHMTITERTLGKHREFYDLWSAIEGVDVVSWLNCNGMGGEGREPALRDGSTTDPCLQPFSTLLVKVDGTAVICCVDYSGSVALGNVFKNGIRKVWGSERFERVRRLHNAGWKRAIPLCARCKTHY